MAEQTTGDPISAFLRGFRGSQDRIRAQQQQEIQNQLAEQLRNIQLMNAQQQAAEAPFRLAQLKEQLRLAQMTPSQIAIEEGQAGIIARDLTQPGVVFHEGGAVEEITPEAQGILNDRQLADQMSGLPFSREGIAGIQMQTPVARVPGAFISPAEIARQQQQVTNQAKFQSDLKRSVETEEERAAREAGLAETKVRTAKSGAILEQIQNISKQGGKTTTPVYDPTGTQVIAYEYFDPIKGATDLIDIKTPKDAETFKSALDQSNKFDDEPAVKNYTAAIASIRGIQNLASDPDATAADDTALIFGFMKSIDPRSTVREGEQASVQNSAGIPDRIRNLYNNAVNGNRLTATQRIEILGAAEKSVAGLKTGYDLTRTRFIDKSRRSNLDENIVVGPVLDHKSIMREFSNKGGAAPQPVNLPSVTTQQQFNSLAPEAQYVGEDGKIYRKPKL